MQLYINGNGKLSINGGWGASGGGYQVISSEAIILLIFRWPRFFPKIYSRCQSFKENFNIRWLNNLGDFCSILIGWLIK